MKFGSPKTGSHENTFKSLLLKLFDGDGLTYDGICKEVYSHLSEVVYFYINDFVRETELRNTVFQYASYLMESLEDVNLIAFFTMSPAKERPEGPEPTTATFIPLPGAIGGSCALPLSRS